VLGVSSLIVISMSNEFAMLRVGVRVAAVCMGSGFGFGLGGGDRESGWGTRCGAGLGVWD
jgi:hypothetical protein